MRGGISYQVHEIFKTLISFGLSKHHDKIMARKNGAIKMHEIGKGLRIYSYNTADSYRDISKDLMSYLKENHGVKDIEKIHNDHVNSFLRYKIDSGCSRATMQLYCSAIEKLELALNLYSKQNSRGIIYHFDLSEIRKQIIKIEKNAEARAYENPTEIIRHIQDKRFRTVATLQYEAGLRISEAIHVRESQLKKNKYGFSLEIKGKGGKVREVNISMNLGEALLNQMEDGLFEADRQKYSRALEKACRQAGETWHGSHGLRHNYGQEKYLQYALEDPENAKLKVSKDLGHNRENITDTYLKIR